MSLLKISPGNLMLFRGLSRQCRRWLNLHEWQSKQLMVEHGLNTQPFCLVKPDSMPQLADWKEYVVKAQVLAGGRGKGVFPAIGLKGGVQITEDAGKAMHLATLMLNQRLVTPQTDAEGAMVRSVMIADARRLVKETYLAILLDRTSRGIVMVGSAQGGMDIEEVAAKHPEAVIKMPIGVNGPTDEQLTWMAEQLGFDGEHLEPAKQQMQRLYQLFVAVDATQVEINPLALTSLNEAFRQAKLFKQVDDEAVDARERTAQENGLAYIGLDGNIGCLVNGAGLAMATMDLLRLHGGSPANFLDVGGSASPRQLLIASQLLLTDPQVKCLMVNIFGGIMRCDLIAQGIIEALNGQRPPKPIIVRLSGSKQEEGLEMIRALGHDNIQVFTDLDAAANAAVQSQ